MNLVQPFYVLALILGITLGSAGTADAATYYVAPSGNDANAGTITQPFATLQKAHDIGVAGDTIYMRGGTYPVSQTTLTRDGTSGNPIKVFNYQGEVPVLDGSSATNQFSSVLYMNSASWWHFKGLEIKNSANHGLGMWNASSNNIIENCNIHHSGRLGSVGNGIKLTGTGGGNQFLNNDLHHNVSQVPGNSDGVSVTTSALGSVVRGNRAWRNGDDGIDLWNSAAVTVENNWSWENGYNDALQPTGGDGNGYKLGGSGSGDGGHLVKNNLSWRNFADGFDDNAANVPMSVYSNTAWENGGFQYAFTAAVANVLKNNVAFPSADVAGSSSVQHTFNTWNLPVVVSATDFVSTDFSGIIAARQADGSLPANNFLKLVSDSDLIDKGINVGIPFNGAAPDLGAYEFGAAPVAPVVSMTAPANGATVSGTAVIVSATATDDVAVVGVQFKFNGNNLGAEDTTAPYSIQANSTQAPNGQHTLSAVARDGSGNSTTSVIITIFINN